MHTDRARLLFNLERILKILAVTLLILVGISALSGGIMLILDSSGISMQFPLELLGPTPFTDYLFPGILLFSSIGVLSLFIAIMTIRDSSIHPQLIIVQGFILMAWLTVQLMLNIDFYFALYHIPLYGVSLILIGIGMILLK